jgi:hypothetical protein
MQCCSVPPGRGRAAADRGRHNTNVDIMGAFGELLLLKLIKPLDVDGAVLAHFRTYIYLADGPAADSTPDLVFSDADTGVAVGVDAKTFDCDKDKRYFAINDGKHEALSGSCKAYSCALARQFGRFAAIARLVPYADVDPAKEAFPEDRWFVGNLASRGSPSRNLFLDTFLRDYFTNPPDLVELRKKPCSRRNVWRHLSGQAAPTHWEAHRGTAHRGAVRRAREWSEREDRKEAERKSKQAERKAANRMAAQSCRRTT